MHLFRQAQSVRIAYAVFRQDRRCIIHYPLGQCLEIAEAMFKRLRSVNEDGLPATAAAGLRALRAFLKAGGAFRQVWGDLRGQYFQNAFQVGTVYIDVANDTVTPNKPKVEILPFHEAPNKKDTHISKHKSHRVVHCHEMIALIAVSLLGALCANHQHVLWDSCGDHV